MFVELEAALEGLVHVAQMGGTTVGVDDEIWDEGLSVEFEAPPQTSAHRIRNRLAVPVATMVLWRTESFFPVDNAWRPSSFIA